MTTLLARVGPRLPVAGILSAAIPLAAATVAGVVAGYEAAQGRAITLAVLTAGAMLAVAIILRPDLAVIGWITALLADGRQLSQFHFGRIYVTEIFLVILVLALLPHLLLEAKQRPGLRRVTAIVATLWVPGAVGLAIETDLINFASARNFAIVYYSLFAVVATIALDPQRNMRLLLFAVILGSTAAVVVAFSGVSGFADEATSSGARRIAHGSFSLPFGIGALVLLAALNQRLVPLKTAFLIPVYLVSLVLVNHRSAWLAFLVAAATLALTRLRPAVVVTGVVAACALVLLFTSEHQNENSTVGQEVARARTITDKQDPNAEFRLTFWRKVTLASLKSPLAGSGFDAYPPEIVAPESQEDPLPAPHNSFVALLYRIGPLPFAIFFALLLGVIGGGFVAGPRELDAKRQALIGALVAVSVYVSIYAAFNVALETPYTGPLFWITVGLLAAAVSSRRTAENP
jgi:hypothetical protein